MTPRLGVGVAAWREDRVLLVRRAKPPFLYRWTLPGGSVRFGERLVDAAARETAEETGLAIRLRGEPRIHEVILPEGADAAATHFVLAVFAAVALAGEARPGDDVDAVRWTASDELEALRLTPGLGDLLAWSARQCGL